MKKIPSQCPESKPCPFGSGLIKFALDFVVVISFKNAEKIASGGLNFSKYKIRPPLKIFYAFVKKNTITIS